MQKGLASFCLPKQNANARNESLVFRLVRTNPTLPQDTSPDFLPSCPQSWRKPASCLYSNGPTYRPGRQCSRRQHAPTSPPNGVNCDRIPLHASGPGRPDSRLQCIGSPGRSADLRACGCPVRRTRPLGRRALPQVEGQVKLPAPPCLPRSDRSSGSCAPYL